MNQGFKSFNEIQEWVSRVKSDISTLYFYRDQSKKNIKLEIRKKLEQILKKPELDDKSLHAEIDEIKKLREKLHPFTDVSVLKKTHKITSEDIESLMKSKTDQRIFSSLKRLLEIQKSLGNFEEGYILNFDSVKISQKFDMIEKSLMSSSAVKKYNPEKLRQIVSSLRSVRLKISTLTNAEAIELFLQQIDNLRLKINKNLSSSDKIKKNVESSTKSNDKKNSKKQKKSLKIIISNKNLDYSVLGNLFKLTKQGDIKKILSLSPFRKFLQSKIEVVIYDIINELKGKSFNDFDEEFSSKKDRKIKQIVIQKKELLKEVSKRLNISIPETEFDIILYDISDNNNLIDSGEKNEFEFFDDSSENNDLLFVSKEYVIYYY